MRPIERQPGGVAVSWPAAVSAIVGALGLAWGVFTFTVNSHTRALEHEIKERQANMEAVQGQLNGINARLDRMIEARQ